MLRLPRIPKFLIACLGFALVNVAFGCTEKDTLGDSFQFQNQDIGWWTVNNFRQLQKRADVLLIGSSLMCRVTNEGEATYLNHDLNGNEHHRCQHMEDLLAQDLHRKVLTTSLSVPGMNASDASVVFSELVKDGKIPDVIVYGIAPRDFLDNGLEVPANTSLYQLMEKTGQLQDVANLSRLTRTDRAKYAANKVLRRIFPLYDKQTELSIIFRRAAKQELAKTLPAPAICELPTLDKVTKSLLHLVPEDSDPYCHVTPYDESHPNTADFKNCYLVSYNPFRPGLYNPQMKFLDRFLKIAKSRNIQVILVNMPLRKDSFNLMPPNLHNLYMQDAQRIATANGANFVDMQHSGFNDADYDDQVHLTGRGASKFVELLTPKLVPYISQALATKEAARQLSASTKTSTVKSF
ncbi:MAG: DUF1574 family protein [Candidatus Obscuribacterales bacterium]|nr:DUF1574 family protein [Candidatus Obscuribacterales bacterium]